MMSGSGLHAKSAQCKWISITGCEHVLRTYTPPETNIFARKKAWPQKETSLSTICFQVLCLFQGYIYIYTHAQVCDCVCNMLMAIDGNSTCKHIQAIQSENPNEYDVICHISYMNIHELHTLYYLEGPLGIIIPDPFWWVFYGFPVVQPLSHTYPFQT